MPTLMLTWRHWALGNSISHFRFLCLQPLPPLWDSGPNPVHLAHVKIVFGISRILLFHLCHKCRHCSASRGERKRRRYETQNNKKFCYDLNFAKSFFCFSESLWHRKSKIKCTSPKWNMPGNTSKGETKGLNSALISSGVNLEWCGHLPDLCSCHKQLHQT